MLRRLVGFFTGFVLVMPLGSAQSQSINYNFSWTGSGSLSQSFTDATFGLSISASTDSVFSVTPASGTVPLYVNTGAADGQPGQLTGILNAPGIGAGSMTLSQPVAVFTDIGIVNGVRQNEGVGFSYVDNSGTVGTQLLTVTNQSFPGITGYDLRSGFGPMAGIGTVEPFSLVFGNSTLNFTGIGSQSFQAVTINAIPEPDTYAMLGLGLGLLGWVVRRKKLQAGLPRI